MLVQVSWHSSKPINSYLHRIFYVVVENESRCLSEKIGVLPVKCPSNTIARVVKAFYGYSWSSDCHFIEKDCVVNVPADDINCHASDCSIKIIESPVILQDCWNLLSSYVQVDYECLSGKLFTYTSVKTVNLIGLVIRRALETNQ